MAKTPRFKGKPIIKTVPGYAVLSNDAFGAEVARRVNSEYAGTPAQLISKPDKDQPFRESNIFQLFAVDCVARDRDLGGRVMLPEEAQLLLDLDEMPERGTTYKDLGLAMDFSGKNHQLALDFFNRLDQENRNSDKFPAVFTGLKPVKSGVGSYGLAFDIMPYSQIRTIKVLNCEQVNFNNSDPELLRTGFPSKLGAGTRTIYAFKQEKPLIENLGLVGFYLSRNSDLYFRDDDLAYSDVDGRVVVWSVEATSQKIAQYAGRLKEQRKNLEAQLARFEKAQRILSGE